ncbi:MAG: site-specific DNA-methyltransferase [Bryobacterales bacterium]|nr:site-specific DNA-methyltransferase [Bryobacterales bacterium]
MDSEFVDCIVTSPPYFWLRDYGVEGQIGKEDSVDEYVSALREIMAEARRVLKRRGVAFLNLGDTYYSGKGKSHGRDAKSKKRRFGLRAVDKSGGLGLGLQRKSLIGIPWRVALALAEDGWVLRSAIIWHRTNRLPEFVRDRPGRTYEFVFMLARHRHYHFEKNELPNKIEEDLWTIPARPRSTAGLSTAPFPDALVKRCLKIGCPTDGTVLDPFVGSGTTVRVALETGRSGIGIDLNGKFCRHASQTLERLA